MLFWLTRGLLNIIRNVPLYNSFSQGVSSSSRNKASCILGSEEIKLQLQELKEHHLEACGNSKIYKEKKGVQNGPKNALFISRLKLIAGKLCSKWDEPFFITNVFPFGKVEIRNETTGKIFKVNRNQLKPFHESSAMMEGDVADISLVKLTFPKEKNLRGPFLEECLPSSKGSDRGLTNKAKDPLRDIGGPMTRLKTKMMKQSLQVRHLVDQGGAGLKFGKPEVTRGDRLYMTRNSSNILYELDPKIDKTLRRLRKGIPKDYIKMKAFPFSLDGDSKDWLYLQPILFNTWGDMNSSRHLEPRPSKKKFVGSGNILERYYTTTQKDLTSYMPHYFYKDGSASEHYESTIVGWVQKPSLTDNSKSIGECECCVIGKWWRITTNHTTTKAETSQY
ncbi:hypothetical protein CR513_43762, partial [Mucuna pruriens]